MPSAPFDEKEIKFLALQAQFLTDLEGVRIANDNRIRAFRDVYGLPDDSSEVMTALTLAKGFKTAEKIAEKDLRNALRLLPFHEWIAETVGLGDKQMGRLLGTILHPCWRYDMDGDKWLPRSVGQLWSYCGYAVRDGVAPRRTRGEQASYNTHARTRVYLIAESCIKQSHSPYRATYDAAREKYAGALHPRECARCGPKGKPAKAGSPLSDGHKYARALRLVGKMMLKDLWIAAGDAGAIVVAQPRRDAPRIAA